MSVINATVAPCVSSALDFSSTDSRLAVNEYAIRHYQTFACFVFAVMEAHPEQAEIVPESNYLHFFSFFEFIPWGFELTRFPRVLGTVRFSSSGNKLICSLSASERVLRNAYELSEAVNVARLRMTLAGQRNLNAKKQKVLVNTRSAGSHVTSDI